VHFLTSKPGLAEGLLGRICPIHAAFEDFAQVDLLLKFQILEIPLFSFSSIRFAI
jgi:hypothetical protein